MLDTVNPAAPAGSRWNYRTAIRVGLYVTVLAVISSHFAVSYLTGTNPYLNLKDYVAGNAPLPFQYRALTAWLLSFVSDNALVQALAGRLPAPFSQPEQLVLLLVVALAMGCFIEIIRRSIALVTADREFATLSAFIAPAAAYVSYIALANTYRLSYPYDIPSLMLFSLGYYFILKEDFLAFALAFLAASLSRETSFFLLVIFVGHRWTNWSSLLRRDGLRLALLVAMFSAVKLALYFMYGTNLRESAIGHQPTPTSGIPGAIFVPQLMQNLDNLASPQYWPSLLSVVGWLWLPVLLGWRMLDRADVRRTLLIVPPLWLAAMLIAGRITEVRVFGEMIPLFAAATALIAKNWLAQHGYRNRGA